MPERFRSAVGIGRRFSVALAGAVVLAFAASPASAQTGGQRPDFTGLWASPRGTGNQAAIPAGIYEFTAAGKAASERNTTAIQNHDSTIDTALKCMPTGFPRLLVGLPFVVMHTPQFLGIVSEADPLARLVYIDAEHRADYWPTYNGDAVAKWDGDTLVIDSINFVSSTFLDMRGLPHSDKLRIVERLRFTGPDAFEDQITVEDPEYYVRPFTFTRRFARSTALPVENVCENARDHPSQPND